MPYVPATCPNCGADLRLDTEMEKGYCVHCGSLINFNEAVKLVKPNGPIEFAGFESLPTLLNLIKRDIKNGTNQTPEFRSHITRALELAPDNQYLYGLVHSQLWNAKIKDNVLVQYNGDAKKVIIPEGIVAIGKMAFARHNHLEEITLPKSLQVIMPNAFIYEYKITINAHKDTYAAKYAMSSPAKLNLLGQKNETEKDIEHLEYMLRELKIYKQSVEQKIEKHFSKAYSIKWLFVFLALLPGIMLIFGVLSNLSFDSLVFYNPLATTIPLLLAIIYIILVIFIVIIYTGYNEIRSKVASKRQTTLYMKNCNSILKPLGIVDFKYERNIENEPFTDLSKDVSQLRYARDRILNMNLTEIYKKPYMNYSVIDFVKGERPVDYKNPDIKK